MPLSDREKQLLEELERNLYASDATLAHKLRRPGASSPQLIVAGAALILAGISLLVVAVIIQLVLFGLVGFLVMLAGLLLATSTRPAVKSAKTNPEAPKPTTGRGSTKNFFEDRWDRRTGQ